MSYFLRDDHNPSRCEVCWQEPRRRFWRSAVPLADEIAVPALGLSRKPTEYPLSSRSAWIGLASHLVYGVSTEAVRKGIRLAA